MSFLTAHWVISSWGYHGDFKVVRRSKKTQVFQKFIVIISESLQRAEIHCRKFVGYVGLDTRRNGVLLDCLLGSGHNMEVEDPGGGKSGSAGCGQF